MNKRGFTLIEILVTVAIFAMLATVLAGIYIAFTNSQNRARASQQLLNDTQYALEVMAREIRNSAIHEFPPRCSTKIGPNYGNCIILQRENGQLISFAESLNNDDLVYILPDCTVTSEPCEWSGIDTAFTSLLYSEVNNINVEKLIFDLDPADDPFEIGSTTHEQPKVTILLETSLKSGRQFEQVHHVLQTTVTSRIYKR